MVVKDLKPRIKSELDAQDYQTATSIADHFESISLLKLQTVINNALEPFQKREETNLHVA